MTYEKNDKNVNLSGAYALNALDEAEAEAFEAYLAESAETRYEVTELRDTAVVLGLAVDPIEPSADLRASIMAKIASTPQLAPIVADAPADSPEPVTTPAVPSAVPAEFETAATTKAKARWFARPATVLASMAAAIAIIAGGVVVGNGVSQSQFNEAQADQLAVIMASPDKQEISADVAGGGTATIAWSNDALASVVMVDGVAALPSDKVYELWYINEDGARPAGTFSVDASDADAWRVLDGEMQAGDQIGVTVEPAGGSTTPTTDPIVAVQTA
jgi:anti-sigma-K factor RskA